LSGEVNFKSTNETSLTSALLIWGEANLFGTRHAATNSVNVLSVPLSRRLRKLSPGRGNVLTESNGTTMARATWNGRVIAESDRTQEMDGDVYFPESSLKREYFRSSSTTSTHPSKGQARFMTVVMDGQDNQDAAWYYPDPKPAARKVKGYVAFWRGVEIEK
jgi:uncharacterized protein (DUF427 family)